MIITKTEIPEVMLIEPILRGDSRGYFMECFLKERFYKEVIETEFVQENESFSNRGVLRGLHYQLPPAAQSKLIRVVTGRILDVAVDIRKGSPTFGKHVVSELSAENKRQLFIPRGFAHGFSVLEDSTIVQYKTDNYYSPQDEAAILWSDPELGIDWGLRPEEILLSEKDKHHPLLKDAKLFDFSANLY
ncbi:MAG: dTDP-4-dehydrorhamnose 3,5-epimerase [Bacteroidales bacterium]